MKIEIILFIQFTILIYCQLANGDAREDVQTAKSALETASSALGTINEFITKGNPGKVFSQISKVLVNLGPALMAVSAVLSIVTMFLPQEDSAELQAINEGFEIVNRRLDVIISDIKDLNTIAEISSAKAAYLQYITIINKNYDILQEAHSEKSNASYKYFANQYENTNMLATKQLYEGLMGTLKEYGFDLLELYKKLTQCNVQLIAKYCTTSIQILTKGIITEGGYLGYLNEKDRLSSLKSSWTDKLNRFRGSCQSALDECQSKWSEIGKDVFQKTYNRDFSEDNQEFADRIAKALDSVVPQRAWIAVVYYDASGFGEHCVQGRDYEMIWNQRGRDVTIASGQFEQPKTGNDFNNFKNTIDSQKNQANSCNNLSNGRGDLRSLTNIISQRHNGVIFAIRVDKNPKYKITGNTIYASDFRWNCNGQTYRILAFQ